MASLAARLRTAASLPQDPSDARARVAPIALLALALALGGLGLAVVGRSAGSIRPSHRRRVGRSVSP